jgi:hypothetical protein
MYRYNFSKNANFFGIFYFGEVLGKFFRIWGSFLTVWGNFFKKVGRRWGLFCVFCCVWNPIKD